MKIKIVSRERAEEILTSSDVESIAAVISIVSPTVHDREFGPVDWSNRPKGLDRIEKRLLLSFDDVSESLAATLAGYHCPQHEDTEAILKFGRETELGDKTLLIHCLAGKSRSTAAAMMLFAQELGPGYEEEARAMVFRACEEDWPMPNKLMITQADHALQRGGRLIRALELGTGSIVRRSDCLPALASFCCECRQELGQPHMACSRIRVTR